MWSDSKKKWLPCVFDFEAYWLASKWLRWKIDYLESRAVITELIFSHKLYLWRKNVMWNSQNLIISNYLYGHQNVWNDKPVYAILQEGRASLCDVFYQGLFELLLQLFVHLVDLWTKKVLPWLLTCTSWFRFPFLSLKSSFQLLRVQLLKECNSKSKIKSIPTLASFGW